MRASILALCLAVLISGCVTTPEFDRLSGVTPRSVIDVIECELIDARRKFPRLQFKKYKDRKPEFWVAVAELALQVDEQATLTPSFTHTNVVSSSLTRVFDWGVKVDTQSQRLYNETVAFAIPALGDDPCKEKRRGFSLNGNLGLGEVIAMAFDSIEEEGDRGIGLSTEGKNKSAFGTTVQFVVIKNINGVGPTWTLSHFKGPGKLFAMQRNDTHKLTISFAQDPNGNIQRAYDKANESNYKLLQQGINLNLNLLQQRLP
jgi:hypothetical protein